MYTHTHTHTHTHTGILYFKKCCIVQTNEIMPFAATWMDLEIIILSEVSETEKDKYCMMFAYMQNLKTNLFMVTSRGRVREG